MKKPILAVLCVIFISNHLFSQAANNTCATATNLGALTGNCISTAGDLYLANNTNPTASCGGNRPDVWYRFTMPASSTNVGITVTLTSASPAITTSNTSIELFNTNGACVVNSTSLGCGNISASRYFGGLTGGNTYSFRVYTTAAVNGSSTGYAFNVCVASNDNCATATTLTPGATRDGSVFGASNSGTATAPCTGTADDDVWYDFTALYTYATITLHNIGSDLNTSGARMQLFSGACAGLTSIACSGGTNVINATGLTVGNTYRLRVYSQGAGQAGTNWGYRISLTPSPPVSVGSGRMNEVFLQQILSAPQVLADPWEITYGPDNNLWITESKGYRLYRMNPITGARDTVLNISQGSTFLPVPDQVFNAQFNIGTNNPQGGFAGMALHPNFLNGLPSEKNYVYISYVYSYGGGGSPTGTFYTNRLVRFTYNTGTGKLGSPVSLCDSLPGSNDHNSQRIIIAPVGGTYYLFYGSGDMGAGQFSNRDRPNKAQNHLSYEGKILRYNLESDGDAGLAAWVPNSNPYGATSAVYSIGIRNNQGFALDTSLNILYGSSHGPYSDDEINAIEGFRNYGHPRVIGFFADGNYNGTTTPPGINTNLSAGAAFTDNTGISSCPPVGNETTNKNAIDAGTTGLYKDPFFSAYPSTNAGIRTIWQTNPGNGGWPSEGWSGLDFYSHKLIPGWKRSLVAGSLKWGRLVRLKAGPAGTTTLPSNTISDTISYFGSINRFRDLAFGPNGKDIYVIMDRSTSTSGPSSANPVVPACQGCVQKYTFLGYAESGGKSTIPTAIDVTDGSVNTPNQGTTITIDATNNNIWVPITGPDGNIMAEIHANGQNLGVVTSSFYQHSGPIRIKNGFHYLNRNITITPAAAGPFSPLVKIRLYISKAEFDALDADPGSGITSGISQLKMLKNEDPISAAVLTSTVDIPITIAVVDRTHGANGYVLQGNVSDFSSFYFGAVNITLPLELVYFKGSLQDNATLLQWETTNESNTSYFGVERSIDGRNFDGIGIVAAIGSSGGPNKYSYTDNDVNNLASSVIYYRLKMVDVDGQYKYSNVVTIYLSDITLMKVSPNPTRGETRMMINAAADGIVNWKLTDNNGKVVMQNSARLRKGNNNITINVSKLSGGVYFLNVSGTGINQKVKLQKL